MYNRYIPQADGSFRRNRMQEPVKPEPKPVPPPPCPPPEPPTPAPCEPFYPPPQHGGLSGFLHQLLPRGFDTGDLFVILLLLLMAGDCPENRDNAILTIALYFLM